MNEIKINPKLLEIYLEAKRFVDFAFSDTKPDQARISILAIMKMLVDLEEKQVLPNYLKYALEEIAKVPPEKIKELFENISK